MGTLDNRPLLITGAAPASAQRCPALAGAGAAVSIAGRRKPRLMRSLPSLARFTAIVAGRDAQADALQ